ncbi:16S rRNA (uracil(1498)-N(3))-methyltransferase [Fictibacillus sp. Mic-4]|uniref:16S rRNA (uracil(1498)-N(3))-methyltransferase n=1 Tax=Fictibacillus TaxID=1329200 RepID=UPI0003F84A68|nr:16S rRNA (uracil(1498)-N(3))-methyltransferase [Fictibacillus gelatini]
MQRYFVKPEQKSDTFVTIAGDDANHIEKVMRMSIGDKIICSDGKSPAVLCEIANINREVVNARILSEIEQISELPISVTIAQGLPKGDKLDFIVQKGTELGASSFLPFSSTRCIVKWDEKKGEKKTARLQKIAKEAAEQSHRSFIPDVLLPVSFQQLLKDAQRYDIKIVAYEEEAKTGETRQLHKTLNAAKKGQSLLCVIGPEGGLTDNEVQALRESGFIACGLGPRILRTETASLYLLSALSYHFELMG